MIGGGRVFLFNEVAFFIFSYLLVSLQSEGLPRAFPKPPKISYFYKAEKTGSDEKNRIVRIR